MPVDRSDVTRDQVRVADSVQRAFERDRVVDPKAAHLGFGDRRGEVVVRHR